MQKDIFVTSDGYRLERRGNLWTDGDLEFDVGPDGDPVGNNAEPVEGCHPWRYYLRNRPPGFATVPKGHVAMESWYPTIKYDVPGVGRAHGWVEYPAPLSEADVESYELAPAPSAEDLRHIECLAELTCCLRSAGLLDEAQTAGRVVELRNWGRLPWLRECIREALNDYVDEISADDRTAVEAVLVRLV